MSFFNALYADLKDRRLWPIGLALLVALVAIPVLLSRPAKESSTETSSASPGATTALPTGSQPVVSLAGPVGNFRRHLGRLSRKNPFVQQARPKAKEAAGLETPTSGTSSGGDSGSLTTTGTDTGTPVPNVPGVGDGTTTPPASGKLVYLTYVVRGSFGELTKTNDLKLKTPRSLPDEKNPVAIFIGVERGAKAAVFVVGNGVAVHGDGECKPTGSECTFVRLKKGDVEFFEVPDANGDAVTTYELDISRISLGVSDSPPGKSSTSGKQSKVDRKAAASRRVADRHSGLSLVPVVGF